ncbi:MAG: preprotein translocase subunit SecE [Acidobacteriota bacterium]|nr:preprotein translocase subunit SecE [Acidobacteriota bacterium]
MGRSTAKESAKQGGVGQFLRDTRGEWDKTTFPSSDDVKNTTIIVIISVIFVTIYLYLVDLGWVFLLDGLTSGVNWLLGA